MSNLQNAILKDNYIFEVCELHGINPKLVNHEQICYLAYFIINKYKNQFNNVKVIK